MNVDERTERLIVRRLDGELTPAEQDELNQILLRSPDARRMLSEYDQNDRLATDMIGAVAEGRLPSEAGPIRAGRSRHVTLWTAIGTGLAAAAALAIVVISPWQDGAVDPVMPGGEHQTVVRPDQPVINGDHLVYTSTELPHRGERRIDRDYIGVFDESRDSLLLLEIDRTRTVRIPVAGDL